MAYVLEDDYDGDYRYEGRPIASLQGIDGGGRVIYVGSFNKILFPGAANCLCHCPPNRSLVRLSTQNMLPMDTP